MSFSRGASILIKPTITLKWRILISADASLMAFQMNIVGTYTDAKFVHI